MKLIDITPSILQSYINNIYNEHMLNSIKNQVDFIKSVLKESYRLKEISENICDFVTTPIKKVVQLLSFIQNKKLNYY
ncbi:integrase [Clostridioides difficile]|nr:integrase [Clostridioides difficile]